MTRQHAPAPFGTLLGVAPGGVGAYSSDYDTADEAAYPSRAAYRSHLDGLYMGYKWQCVEFARRWLYLDRGYIFEDVAMAYEIFRLRSVRRPDTGETLPLHAFKNGARRHPEPGCLLVWNEGGTFEHTGHVAVVVEVLDDRLRIADQNFDHRPWPAGQGYAREIPARITEDGGYWLRCGFGEASILGWVIQTADDRFAETFVPPDPRLFAVHHGFTADQGQTGQSWLNVANPDEAAYVTMSTSTTATPLPATWTLAVCRPAGPSTSAARWGAIRAPACRSPWRMPGGTAMPPAAGAPATWCT